jgi:multidrug resistance efflux pump
VKAGDVLARLDDSALVLLEKGAELELRAARVTLKELESGTRPEEIEEARARVDGARAELEQARRDLEKSRSLFEQKALDRRTLEHEEVAVDTARSRLRALEKRVRLLEAGPRLEARERAALDVERAAVRLEEIRDRIDETVLRAPFAGRVTLRYLDPGEMAGPDRPVLTVSDLDHLEAVLEVDEYDLGALRRGLPVLVTTRALPGEVFRSEVREVGHLVGKRRARGDDPTVVYDSRVIEARVPLSPDGRLRAGMTVDGEIVVVRKKDVVLLPLRALREDADGHPVVAVGGTGDDLRRVTLGARDHRDVEILDGLVEGDVVRMP